MTTDHQPLTVANLQRIWAEKKRTLKLTQTQAAKELGWTQGAFSQYLNGVTELNPAAVLKLAKYLEVLPEDIDPSFRTIELKKVQCPACNASFEL